VQFFLFMRLKVLQEFGQLVSLFVFRENGLNPLDGFTQNGKGGRRFCACIWIGGHVSSLQDN
jgi:hypothetical protein